MAQDKFKRKLTTILSADVAGYSRLMGEDEAATVRTLEAYKGIMSELIRQHRGRVVDSPGDNLLAEFASVVDAVQCAVTVQKELQARNAELPENRRMQFRIGVNLGDVIEEESRIYGDGVNIAARLESLTAPGGITISKTAFDQIEMKLPLGYEFLGEQTVKNIVKPVGAYRVILEPRVTKKRGSGLKTQGARWRLAFYGILGLAILTAAATVWQFAKQSTPSPVEKAGLSSQPELTLSDKPSIAVLPFANISNDPEQEYFCDGISDQIINSIANIPYIEVIARNSSFAYKGKSVNVQQIASDLGVRYLLEGSLQRDNENVRINTQLIDAKTGRHLWAEHYDRKLADIFLVQDEICKNIMVALQVKLTVGESARTVSDTVSIKAYENFLKGTELILRRTKEDVLVARQMGQEAIALDPNYAAAYLLIGWSHLDEVWFGMTKTPEESIVKAEEMAQKAVSIHGVKGEENSLLSSVNLLKKDLDKAISYAEKALEQRPNSAVDHFILGMALRFNGQYEEAIARFKKALQLNPVKPLNYLNNLAWAYLFSRQYEKAIPIWNETLERNPDYLFAYMGLTQAYWLSGLKDQARQAAKHVLRINPKFSVDFWGKQDPTKDKELKEQLLDALRKAGLK